MAAAAAALTAAAAAAALAPVSAAAAVAVVASAPASVVDAAVVMHGDLSQRRHRDEKSKVKGLGAC